MTNIDEAFDIYTKFIYNKKQIELLREFKLKIAGSVPSVLWELFGAVLTGSTGTGHTGSDLLGWEIKSAKNGSSFEYQYHLNTGLIKLADDCKVKHLFISYDATYENVIVRVIKGNKLAATYFKLWEPEYIENYKADIAAKERRQRFRKSIPYNHIKTNGIIILEIKNTKLVLKKDLELKKLLKTK